MRVLFILILLLSLAHSATGGNVSVIAHPDVPIDTVTRAQLLDFYTRDIVRFDTGGDVTIFDLKPKDGTRKAFYGYLGKSSSRMKSIWMKRLLSGEGDPPEAFPTEDDMLDAVMSTPGSMGFIASERVNDSVKVLLVIEDDE